MSKKTLQIIRELTSNNKNLKARPDLKPLIARNLYYHDECNLSIEQCGQAVNWYYKNKLTW